MRSGYRCAICGATDIEVHNLLFGAKTTDPKGFCDPDLYACLCAGHHRILPEAAHVSNDTFLSIYLGNMEDRDRANKIMKILETPYDGKSYIDYKVEHRKLVEQFKKLEKTAYMDQF